MKENDLTPPHSNYAKHFTAEFYEDLTNELAPFGSDEGYDVISLAEESWEEINESTTVEGLLELVDAPLSEDWNETLKDEEALEDAAFISSAAFALIRITGQIDSIGRTKAIRALDILLRNFGDENELLQQKVDLETWANFAAEGSM